MKIVVYFAAISLLPGLFGAVVWADRGPCEVKAGVKGMVLRGTLLTAQRAFQGEVVVGADGRIICAEENCRGVSGYSEFTQINCPDAVISAGLINAHEHLNYNLTGPGPLLAQHHWDHRNEWRKGTNNKTPLPYDAPANDSAILAAIELRHLMAGTTSVVSSGGIKGLLRNLAPGEKPANLEGLVGKEVVLDTFPLGDGASGEMHETGCGYTKPQTPDNAFWRGAYVPHLAEGITAAATNEFACMARWDLIRGQTAIIHGVGLTPKEIRQMRDVGAKLIWSPRSNISLYGDTALVSVFRSNKIPIALGTDWLPSGSMNMFRELRCADDFNKRHLGGLFSDRELFAMATANAALAVGFEDEIGSLRAGLWADLVIISNSRLDYRAVIDGAPEDVQLVMRGGKILYGASELVAKLLPPASCEETVVCGELKSICLDVPRVAFRQVVAAAKNLYPLFACRRQTPLREPTCEPFRVGNYPVESGSDMDGDGVVDALDNCPAIFNPIRPGKQIQDECR